MLVWLERHGVSVLVDVRRWRSSSEFHASFDEADLRWRCQHHGVRYVACEALAPPAAWLDEYSGRHDLATWEEYARRYRQRLGGEEQQRAMGALLGLVLAGETVCLLCAEGQPMSTLRCHRLLVAERISELAALGNVQVSWTYVRRAGDLQHGLPRLPDGGRRVVVG